jgi:hypothetical protein
VLSIFFAIPLYSFSFYDKPQVMNYLILLLSLFSFFSVSQTCQQNPAQLVAHYQTSQQLSQPASNELKEIKQQFSLYRNGNAVIHQYPEQGLAHLWFQMKNQQVSLTRYFLSAQRGIEYQPQEITDVETWQQKQQLLAADFLDKFTLRSQAGQGCHLLQDFVYQQGEHHFELTWYPALQLIKDFKATSPHNVEQWTLTELNLEAKAVKEKFIELNQFNTTDYSDIGDNEADPFLAKMIQQGFKTEVIVTDKPDITTEEKGHEHEH